MSSNDDFFSAVVDVGAPHSLGFWWDGYKSERTPAHIQIINKKNLLTQKESPLTEKEKLQLVEPNEGILNKLVKKFADVYMGKKKKIALGLECPLWIPLAKKFENYSKARLVDRPAQEDHPQYLLYHEKTPIANIQLPPSLPWSAGAGACVSMIGIAFIATLFRDLLAEINPEKDPKKILPRLVTDPQDWKPGDILIWEAFVSSKRKKDGNEESDDETGGVLSKHDSDAKKAGDAFLEIIINPLSSPEISFITPMPVFFIKCEGEPIIYPESSQADKDPFISLLEVGLGAAGWSLDNANNIQNRPPLAIRLEK